MLMVGPLILLIMHCLDLPVGGSDIVGIAATSIVSALTVFIVRRAHRDHAILIEVTLTFLLRGGRALLDQLLGKMISGSWKKEHLKPGDALFDVLEEICHQDDYSLKRRVAEAIPVLGEVDANKTLEVVSILREDWDEGKWKADLRRRALEGLVNPLPTGGVPLIHRLKPLAVEPLLKLRASDDFFTAIAALEVLSDWRSVEQVRADRLRSDLLNFADQALRSEESAALHTCAEFLKQSMQMDIFGVARHLKEMSSDQNVLVRVAAARNVYLLFDRLPDDSLGLLEGFIDPAEDKDVRRAVAKERNVDFLIKAIRGKKFRSRAEAIFGRLISDTEPIIRETAFDTAESLKDGREDFLSEICGTIIRSEPSQSEPCVDLLERAKTCLAELPPHNI
jgi:hypothetical protein